MVHRRLTDDRVHTALRGHVEEDLFSNWQPFFAKACFYNVVFLRLVRTSSIYFVIAS